MSLFSLFSTGADKPLLGSQAEVDRLYARHRMRIMLAITIGYGVAYTCRLALSAVSTDLRREFGMNEQDYSHIVSLFMLAYATMYAGSGFVVDRLGTRIGYAVFNFSWSVAT